MSDWEKAGHCPVDAGCIVLVDPCYVAHDGQHLDPYKDAIGWGKEDYDRGYRALANNLGIVVSSGYGDGEYPVYIKRTEGGRIASVKVVFVDEEPCRDHESCDMEPCWYDLDDVGRIGRELNAKDAEAGLHETPEEQDDVDAWHEREEL